MKINIESAPGVFLYFNESYIKAIINYVWNYMSNLNTQVSKSHAFVWRLEG